MRSTWKVMPNLNWALLGEDAMNQVESFKAEAAKTKATRHMDVTSSPIIQKDVDEHTSTPEHKSKQSFTCFVMLLP